MENETKPTRGVGRPAKIRRIEDITAQNFRSAPEQLLRKLLSSNGIPAEMDLKVLIGQVEQWFIENPAGVPRKEPPPAVPELGAISVAEVDDLDERVVRKILAQQIGEMSPEQMRSALKKTISRPVHDPYAETKVRVKIIPTHSKQVGKHIVGSCNGESVRITNGTRNWLPITKKFLTSSFKDSVRHPFTMMPDQTGETQKDYFEERQYSVQVHPEDYKYFPEGLPG